MAFFTALALTLFLRVRKGWRVIPWIGAAAAGRAMMTIYVMPLVAFSAYVVALREGVWASVRKAFAGSTGTASPSEPRSCGSSSSAGRGVHGVLRTPRGLGVSGQGDHLLVQAARKGVQRVGGALVPVRRRGAVRVPADRRGARLGGAPAPAPQAPGGLLPGVGASSIAMYTYLGEKTPWSPGVRGRCCRSSRSPARSWRAPFRRAAAGGPASAGLAATAWSALAPSFLYPAITTSNPHAEHHRLRPDHPRGAGPGQPGPGAGGENTGKASCGRPWTARGAGRSPGSGSGFRFGGRHRRRGCGGRRSWCAIRTRKRRCAPAWATATVKRIPLRAWWVEDAAGLTPAAVVVVFTRLAWSPIGATEHRRLRGEEARVGRKGRRNVSVELSVVVPIYDERRRPTVRRLTQGLGAVVSSYYEIVLVDDGSHDRTWELIKGLAERSARASRSARNFGHQMAVTAGLDHARRPPWSLMDADLQDPPEVHRRDRRAMRARATRRPTASAPKRPARATSSSWTARPCSTGLINGFRRCRSRRHRRLPADGARPSPHFRRFSEHHRFTRGMVWSLGSAGSACPTCGRRATPERPSTRCARCSASRATASPRSPISPCSSRPGPGSPSAAPRGDRRHAGDEGGGVAAAVGLGRDQWPVSLSSAGCS